MKRLLSREGLRERVTLTLTIRALAISVAAFALVVSFAIIGGYQGLAAQHDYNQATRNYISKGHTDRLQVEADLQAQIQDSTCTLIALIPVTDKLPEPFRSKVIAIIKKYDCETYNRTHHHTPPVIPKTSTPSKSGGPSSGPKASSGSLKPQAIAGGASPTSGGSRRPGRGNSSTPRPQPTPTPTRTPSPPIPPPVPLAPILTPVCNVLTPLVHCG